MTDYENEKDIVRLSEILETIKKDALEVTDLIVSGIDYYRLLAYGTLAFGIIFAVQAYLNTSGPPVTLAFYLFFAVTFLALFPFGYRKHRQLQKKYHELIEIKKSLTED